MIITDKDSPVVYPAIYATNNYNFFFPKLSIPRAQAFHVHKYHIYIYVKTNIANATHVFQNSNPCNTLTCQAW